MTPAPARAPVSFHFLPGGRGDLFAACHSPAEAPADGGVLCVQPFAEEANKSRRMLALAARALAGRGLTVLGVDPFGCGDSEGCLDEADWDLWLSDLARAWRALGERADGPRALLGLRLGALLAVELSRRVEPAPDRLVLWQPVLSGSAALTEFLRLRTAGSLAAGGEERETAKALRARLEAGETLEIAGYPLGPRLAAALDGATLGAPAAGVVHWMEVVPGGRREVTPAASRILARWGAAGIEVSAEAIPGEPFWRTLEIAECPALVDTTVRALAGDRAPEPAAMGPGPVSPHR